MKKLSLLITLSLGLMLCVGQTNKYHQFSTDNAVWNFNYKSSCFAPPYGAVEYNYSINMSGDTTINSLIYHKIYVPHIEMISTCGSGAGVITTGYKGAIREDTTVKIVYIIPSSSSSEEILYDFTMQIGDTASGITQCSSPNTINLVDSVLVGNGYRNRTMDRRPDHIVIKTLCR